MDEVLILITTESNEEIAKNIAYLLLKNRLAACVSVKKINSKFMWENKIEEMEEFEITIKSKPELKDDLIEFLQTKTTYDIPQIVYKKFHANTKYLDWITNSI